MPKHGSPDQTQSQKEMMFKGLTKYGYLAREHWKEHLPKMYRELRESGQLMPVLLELQETISDQISEMIANGASPHEAWEIAREQIFLPAEDDETNQNDLPEPEIIG